MTIDYPSLKIIFTVYRLGIYCTYTYIKKNWNVKYNYIIYLLVILFSTFHSFKIYAYTSFPFSPNSEFSTTVDLTKKLDSTVNLELPSLGMDFFIASDEDENFYLPTYSGYAKFDKLGNLLQNLKINNNYQKISNVIYANGKIIILSKNFPGMLYIYDSKTNSLLNSYVLFNQNEQPVPISMFSLTDLTVDKAGLNVYFLSNSPHRFYNFNLLTNTINYFSLKENLTVFTGGDFVYAPTVLSDSKVSFVSSKDTIYVFDVNNIATYIGRYNFGNGYAFLNSISSGGNVPSTFSTSYYYTKYNDYLCSFDLVASIHNLCKKYIDLSLKENSETINPISVNEDLVISLSKSTPQGSKEFYVRRADKDINKKWETKITGNVAYGGIYKDGKDNLITNASYINILNSDSGEVLGTYDTKVPTGFYTTRVSLPSITKNNDFYVFVQNKKNSPQTLENYIFKFKGNEIVKPNPCPLGFYCNSKPKHNPVILIHGLGGYYQNFMDEKTGILRTKILEEYRQDDPEFPDTWAYSYSYGYKFDGSYNYQGKIEDISSNLHFDVERLSNENKLAGGDGKVDLIGYSLGGLIARHYILEKTGYPGVQNLDADTKINKVIFIASPINGSTILGNLSEFKLENPRLGNLLIDGLNKGISDYQHESIDITKDAGEQLKSSSEYLQSLNRYYLPSNIKFYRDYSNIKFRYGYKVFDNEIYRDVEVGDIAVRTQDTNLVNANFSGEFLKEQNLNLYFSYTGGTLDFDHTLVSDNIKFNHLQMPSNSEIISSVLAQLKE